MNEEAKKIAGEYAAGIVRSGQIVGMGTGTTVRWAIKKLGERLQKKEIKNVLVLPSSYATLHSCEEQNIELVSFSDPRLVRGINLFIDGADAVDPRGFCIKGGGGAHLYEKIIAYRSKIFVLIIDESKKVASFAKRDIPLEVLPPLHRIITREIESLGGHVTLRLAKKKIGPLITENGNLILDVRFTTFDCPQKYEDEFNAIPGLIASGLFTQKLPLVVVGRNSNGSVDIEDFRTSAQRILE